MIYNADCIDVMFRMEPESIDLIYLDPPFNKHQTFKGTAGEFDDNTDKYYYQLYARLDQMHKLLKPTGSIYLHCDHTASHYIKIQLDEVFGNKNFINEIIWKRYGSHNDAGKYGVSDDRIFYYSKSNKRTWNPIYTEYDPEYVRKTYRYKDENGKYGTFPLHAPGESKGITGKEWRGLSPGVGRHWQYPPEVLDQLDRDGFIHWNKAPRRKIYLKDAKGVPLSTLWLDVPALSGAHKERVGYPTQKPLALLERIITASSNEGDTILDPYCGSGTTLVASYNLHRKYIGIDKSLDAVRAAKMRLDTITRL